MCGRRALVLGCELRASARRSAGGSVGEPTTLRCSVGGFRAMLAESGPTTAEIGPPGEADSSVCNVAALPFRDSLC